MNFLLPLNIYTKLLSRYFVAAIEIDVIYDEINVF